MIQNQPNDDSDFNRPISSEESLEESVEEILIPLEQVKDKVSFLSDVGIQFLVYFSACALINCFLLLDMRMAKQAYRSLMLSRTLVPLIVISLFIKLSFQFLGEKLRRYARILFIIDFLLFGQILLGLYFWLDERLRQYYIYQGHYIIIGGFTLVINSIFYIIATCIRTNKKKKRKFNVFLSFMLMEVSTLVGFVVSSNLFTDIPMQIYEYVIFFVCISLFNFYLCHDSYLLIRYRAKNFYQHETDYAFFTIWFDFLFVYWKDVFVNSKIYKKAQKRKKLAQKAQKQKELENKNKMLSDIESK